MKPSLIFILGKVFCYSELRQFKMFDNFVCPVCPK